jgi:fructose transport system substrate-binding protein
MKGSHTGFTRASIRFGGALLAAGLLAATSWGSSHPAAAQDKVTTALIVKTLSNPFFIAMGAAAKDEAAKKNVTLIYEAGKYDGDNATQTSQIDDLVTRGVKVISISPNLSSGIAPAVKRAQAAGVKVLAIDTALDPIDLSDSFVATDNLKAGVLNGQWAKQAMGSTTAKIALLEGTPGGSVNTDRKNGFLQGFGANAQSLVVADEITNGDQGKGQTAMENILNAHPDVNLVWTINEPAALGAATAIKARGLSGKIKIVSMDGGCRGVKGVQDGLIDSDVMQFPKKMGTAAVDFAVDISAGKTVPKRVDTGEILITKTSTASDSASTQTLAFGLANCW